MVLNFLRAVQLNYIYFWALTHRQAHVQTHTHTHHQRRCRSSYILGTCTCFEGHARLMICRTSKAPRAGKNHRSLAGLFSHRTKTRHCNRPPTKWPASKWPRTCLKAASSTPHRQRNHTTRHTQKQTTDRKLATSSACEARETSQTKPTRHTGRAQTASSRRRPPGHRTSPKPTREPRSRTQTNALTKHTTIPAADSSAPHDTTRYIKNNRTITAT